MLDFRGIMHIKMNDPISMPLEEVFILPHVFFTPDEHGTLQSEEKPEEMREGWPTAERYYNARKERFTRAVQVRNTPAQTMIQREKILAVLSNREQPRFVLLGDPGAGKTTLLRYLLLQQCRQQWGLSSTLRGSIAPSFLPLYIPLSSYASALYANNQLKLVDFLPDWLEAHYFQAYKDLLQTALARGHLLLLLDGLDEVSNQELRKNIVEALDYFASTQNGNYIVVTSRIVGYSEAQLSSPLYKTYTLADFTIEQVKEFTSHWYPVYEQYVNHQKFDTPRLVDEAEQGAMHLFQATQRHPGVKRLAVNPLLLTILCLIQRQMIDLPAHRVELFDLCVTTLVDTWLRAKGYLEGNRISKNNLFKILRPLAFWMHTEYRATASALKETTPYRAIGAVPEAALEKQIRAQLRMRNIAADEKEEIELTNNFLDTVRGKTGILVERGEKLYGFLHLTFEEYFAARQLVVDRERIKFIQEHLHDPHWREVILLAAGTMGILQNDEDSVTDLVQDAVLKANSPYEHWLRRDLLFAGLCLADDIGTSMICQRTILHRILYLYFTSAYTLQQRECLQIMMRWKGLRIGQAVEEQIIPLLRMQVTRNQANSQQLPRIAELPPFEYTMRTSYQRIIQQHNKALEQVFRLLLLVVLQHSGYSELPASAIDKNLLLANASWQIRQLATTLFAQLDIPRNDLGSIFSQALRDPQPEVRCIALEALAYHCHTLDLNEFIDVLNYASSDPDPLVRQTARNTRSRWQQNQPADKENHFIFQDAQYLPIWEEEQLKNIYRQLSAASQHSHPEKRHLALLELQKQAEQDQAFLDLLEEIARNENSPYIRRTIFKVLEQTTPKQPVKRAVLLKELLEDPQAQVRCNAVLTLSHIDNNQAAQLMSDLSMACFDPDPYVREAYVYALENIEGAEKEKLSVWLDVVRQDTNSYVREAAIIAMGEITNQPEASLEALLTTLTDLAVNPDTKIIIQALKQLSKKHPQVVIKMKNLVTDLSEKGYVKQLAYQAGENYSQQIYIEALARNLKLLAHISSAPAEVVDELLQLTNSSDAMVRCMAVTTLSDLGTAEPMILNRLLHLLADVDKDVRQEVAKALSELGKLHKQAIKIMECLLKESLTEVEQLLQTTEILDNTTKETLFYLFREHIPIDTRAIIQALGKSNYVESSVIETLLSLLLPPTMVNDIPTNTTLRIHPSSKQAVIETLAQLGKGNPKVIHALSHILHTDLDVTVRTSSVSALAQVSQQDRAIIDELTQATKDKSYLVRQAAIKALGEMPSQQQVIDALIQAYQKDPVLPVRKAAVAALIKHNEGQPKIQNLLLQDLTNKQIRVRQIIAPALAQLDRGNSSLITALIQALEQDTDASVRGDSALSLGNISSTQDIQGRIEALIHALNKPDATVQRAAAFALGKVDSDNTTKEQICDALLDALADQNNAYVKQSAAFSLAAHRHYPELVVSILRDSLLDANEETRQDALIALSYAVSQQEQQTEIIEEMLHMLFDTNQAVREVAAYALARVQGKKQYIQEKIKQHLEYYEPITRGQYVADAIIDTTFFALQQVVGEI